MFLSYGPPHAPYRELPFEDLERASRAELELRRNVLAEDANPVDLALYYAACEAIDRLVGRLRDGLRELGLEGETLLVFTSDHGSMLGSHGLSGKQTPFEEAISVPLVLSQPGRLPRAARPQALFSALDFAPTLCGLLGADPEPDWSGADLSAHVLGHPGEEPTSVYLAEMLGLGRCFTQDIHTWRGVRTSRWTYAEDGAGPWLLYDLERDPYHLENLVARPELAEKRVELARELGAWAARLDDPRTSPRQQALAAGAGDELSGLHTRILEELQPSEELARRLRTYLEAGEAVPCRRF